MTTVTFTSSGTWNSPAGLTSTDCQCWGEGGNGANGLAGGSSHSGGGGGGGEYAEETALVVHGSAVYTFTIGGGGSGTNTSFPGDSVTVTAHAGGNAAATSGGTTGTGSANTIHHDGGHGGNGIVGSSKGGGGGASSAGTGSAGTNGGTGSASAGSGGTAPSGGGNGGDGSGATASNAQDGSVPGGAGGGGSTHAGSTGANGAGGQLTLNYTASIPGTAALAGVGSLTATALVSNTNAPAPVVPAIPGRSWLRRFGWGRQHQVLQGRQVQTITGTAAMPGVGTLAALGGLPSATVVNQWANSYGQGTVFGSTTSAFQSCVVPLNSSFSVGAGSGTPTAGNWLFAIASWTQDPQIANVHVGVSDDTHPWWREFPASGPSQKVRTSISYVPNIGTGSADSIVPQYVYVAPDMEIAAINVLIVEVAGLGSWDTLIAETTNFAGSGTSLNLALGAPGTAAFTIAGVGGDNISSGQAFAPGGWTTLATQTQTNGVDTSADNILTAAMLPSTVGSISVNATSSSENLSGFILQVRVSGLNPVPASQNPNWPLTKFEVAFGAGFNTPNSELTWTDLTARLWSWDETTGIQFQLGQLQATNLNFEIDNFDGALTPVSSPWTFTVTGTPSAHSFFTVSTAQSASISLGDGFTDTSNAGTFFTVTNIGVPSAGNVNVTFSPSATNIMSSPDVVTQASLVAGTPVRLRMALSVIGGQTINRWYIIQRNAHEWEEEVNATYRKWCPVSGTDIWSAMSSVAPTFYRSEIYEDSPYAWYPMDDQPLEGGVLPTSLLNAATGNTKVLTIASDPGGVTQQDTYGFNGDDITSAVISGGFFFTALVTPPAGNIASYQVGANSGWMYGDQPSSVSSISASGNPVEASPGAASWQQSGLLGSGGSNGWYLICNDASFPGLSGGITLKGWFNAGLPGSGSGYAYVPPGGIFHDTSLYGQPFTAITICELATASAPVAVLQLDTSGHLNLVTYNGSTGTSHPIYSASDLRNNSWMAVDITLTTTTWEVMLNGGLTADVSGSATGMTSAWTYLILCGDFGAGGGTSSASLAHGGNMALSHWAVFPYILPDWRILSHYTAAITGFGLLPAPSGGGIAPVSSPPVNVSTSVSAQAKNNAGYQTTPDGLYYDGSYGQSGNSPATYAYSLVVTSNAGGYSSGPSARTTSSGIGQVINFTGGVYNAYGFALWLSWLGVSPQFTIYSSAAAAAEKLLGTVVADGTSVTSGYGSGASPPSAATPLGDTVGQRIERLLRNGRCTSPQRSIDPSPGLVQAPGSTGGGAQTGTSVQAIQQSDSGMLFVDNPGKMTYWMRSHLASQYSKPVWTLTPNAPPTPGAPLTAVPYWREYRLVSDPQRIFNVITVQPFSPGGAQLPLLTPTNSAGVLSSQAQYGAQPYPVTSWLQDQTEMQLQANWLFSNFGQPQVRAENVRIDAASYPAAWKLVAGINVGDVITLQEWQIGGSGAVHTLRVTEINRKFRFGGQDSGNSGDGEVVASVELTCDFEPTSYWS